MRREQINSRVWTEKGILENQSRKGSNMCKQRREESDARLCAGHERRSRVEGLWGVARGSAEG
eukprot:1668083-Rhodomonas_salina.1